VLLRDAGHDSIHVRDLGLASATDDEVLARAAEDRWVLVTADRGDFGRLLAASGATAPSVVLLRQLPTVVRAADVAALLLLNLVGPAEDALDPGAFVVLTPGSARVRRLPLR
jgi:predicted nuclease of predicted toxin-antitoxin system